MFFYPLLISFASWKQETNYSPWTKSWLLHFFVNNVLLEHGHAHLFMSAFPQKWQSRIVMTDVVWPTKAKTFTIWPINIEVC